MTSADAYGPLGQLMQLVDEYYQVEMLDPSKMPLVQKQIEDHAKEQGIPVDKAKENLLKEKQPMLQFSTPEHLGALTVYLCSDAAATITGTTVSMDGGWTAQ